MITRTQMMNKENTFHDYNSQFVTERMVEAVVDFIGKDRLLNSKDQTYFNDIPLEEWGRLIEIMKIYLDKEKWSKAGNGVDLITLLTVEEYTGRYHWAPSVGVSLAKTAARKAVARWRDK